MTKNNERQSALIVLFSAFDSELISENGFSFIPFAGLQAHHGQFVRSSWRLSPNYSCRIVYTNPRTFAQSFDLDIEGRTLRIRILDHFQLQSA